MGSVATERRLAEIRRDLSTIELGSGSCLPRFLAQLRPLVDADRACSYSLVTTEQGYDLDHGFDVDSTLPAATYRRELGAWIRQMPRMFAFYDPNRPSPSQRNRVLAVSPALRSFEVGRMTVRGRGRPRFLVAESADQQLAVERSVNVFRQTGLGELENMRVLICDGPALLAYVGFFREGTYSHRDVAVLQGLIPALQRRIALERRLGDTPWALQALDAALEQLGRPALIVALNGRVLHANTSGQVWLADRGRSGAESLSAAIRSGGSHSEFDLTPISKGVGQSYYLVQVRIDRSGRAIALVETRWGLTPRQVDVLRHLVRGASNKEIALNLNLAPGTVEVHVHALLTKAQCESRSALVARVWSEADR